jgi:hypothetical protein
MRKADYVSSGCIDRVTGQTEGELSLPIERAAN